jgi:hypothetical protein
MPRQPRPEAALYSCRKGDGIWSSLQWTGATSTSWSRCCVPAGNDPGPQDTAVHATGCDLEVDRIPPVRRQGAIDLRAVSAGVGVEKPARRVRPLADAAAHLAEAAAARGSSSLASPRLGAASSRYPGNRRWMRKGAWNDLAAEAGRIASSRTAAARCRPLGPPSQPAMPAVTSGASNRCLLT